MEEIGHSHISSLNPWGKERPIFIVKEARCEPDPVAWAFCRTPKYFALERN
jgi:hypothetical protein